MSFRSRAYPWWSDRPRRATNAHNRVAEDEDDSHGWGWWQAGRAMQPFAYEDGKDLPPPHRLLGVPGLSEHPAFRGVAPGWDWGALWRELKAQLTTDWLNEVFLKEPRRRVPPARPPVTAETFLPPVAPIPSAFYVEGYDWGTALCPYRTRVFRVACSYCLGIACYPCGRHSGTCNCGEAERHSTDA